MSSVHLPQRFELVRELGRGSTGTVHEVFDRERGTKVAVKTLPSDDPLAVARFKREFRALAGIHHRNLVSLGELFCEGGQWAFSMELVEGTDFIAYVRGPSELIGFDEERLRDALSQLAGALAALHATDRIHRDVKPSNIRVRDDGRLYLLDFGLALELHAREHVTAGENLVGTPAYMAPEQAAGDDTGPLSDMYSVGVLLFEAITGRLPFEGKSMELMIAKQSGNAPRVRSFAPLAPEDLDILCARLLSLDARERLSASTVVSAARASTWSRTVDAGAFITRASVTPTFVGRTQQLADLESAFARVLAGAAATVILEAESGAGKSLLAKQFIDRVSTFHPTVVVFQGRCYENESVPYNAWDGPLEALASHWHGLPTESAAALLPMHIAPLVQTFPALQRVRTVSRAVTRRSPNIVPQEVQRRAFSALREVLCRATQQAPLILLLDDLQWADDDSLMLLGEVLREPSPPPLLLLGVTRPLADYAHVERELRAVLPPNTLRCHVPSLSKEDAIELATTLLARESPELVDKAESIALEAGGHALFIAELARHVIEGGATDGVPPSLEAALWSRVRGLPDAARALVVVLSLAARPLPEVIATAAADLEPEKAARAIAALRTGHLTRSARVHGVMWLETYHDRLRKAVASQVTPDQRRLILERVAIALQGSPHADSNMLAEYWKAAGDTVRGARYARDAAEQACAALAFDRAARLYGDALEHADTAEDSRSLRLKQADALKNAGKLAESGALLVALAAGAEPLESIDLKRAAAELFICSGRFEEGTALLRETLAKVGERFPETPFAIIFWLVVTRVRLALRGLRRKTNVRPQRDEREKVRISTLWSAGTSFSMTDNVRGAYFITRTLLRALDSRDKSDLLLPLLMELTFVSSEGRKAERRVAAMLAMAEAVAAGDERPIASAMLFSIPQGWVKYMSGDWEAAVRGLAEAERQMRDGVVGFRFQLATIRTVLYRALINMGRFEELRERLPPVCRDARRQNDLFLVAGILSHPDVWVGFADDRPDRVDADIKEVERGLSPSRFLLQHFYAVVARCNLQLYCGEVRAAYERQARAWGPLRRSFLLRIAPVRAFAYEARARCAIALAAVDRRCKESLLREATLCARKLEGERIAYATAHAELIHALVAASRNSTTDAIRHFERAITLYDGVHMGLHSAAARFRLGSLVGGALGEEWTGAAHVWARRERVVAPERLFGLIAPGDAKKEGAGGGPSPHPGPRP